MHLPFSSSHHRARDTAMRAHNAAHSGSGMRGEGTVRAGTYLFSLRMGAMDQSFIHQILSLVQCHLRDYRARGFANCVHSNRPSSPGTPVLLYNYILTTSHRLWYTPTKDSLGLLLVQDHLWESTLLSPPSRATYHRARSHLHGPDFAKAWLPDGLCIKELVC